MQAKTLTMNQTIHESEHESVLPPQLLSHLSLKGGMLMLPAQEKEALKLKSGLFADSSTGPTVL